MSITTPRRPDRLPSRAGQIHGSLGHGRPLDDQRGKVRDPRLRRRRGLLLWSAVPVAVVLGAAAKLLSLGLLAGQAAAAFDAKDTAAAETAAAWLQPLNIAERHKAPFAAGDAKVLGGDFEAARQRFAEALDLVPPAAASDGCVVRVNLVLATEALGDAKLHAEDPSSAASLFADAQEVVAAAPDGCFPPAGEDDAAAEAGERLHQAEQRLADKLTAAGQTRDGSQEPDAGPDPTDQDADRPQQSQLEQLEESARQSQRERNTGREREDYLNEGYAPGPDRPW